LISVAVTELCAVPLGVQALVAALAWSGQQHAL
jgi:hypothetical protein